MTGVRVLLRPAAADHDDVRAAAGGLRQLSCGTAVGCRAAVNFRRQFDYTGAPDRVVIDLSAAHIRDASSVAALDAIGTKYVQRGGTVEIIGLNDPSADLHGRLTGELAGSH